ncbi:MAG TPA: TIGR01906 family membrane protein [Dehalococcoidia bacterium]|nr:TIGR01906 family membrane protein [Dehalococcoidia bacterium]
MSTSFPRQREAPHRWGRPGPLRFAATLLFVVALPVLIVTTGVRVLFSLPQVYDYSVHHFDAASLTGIPEAELKRANRELVRYFADDRSLLQLEVTDERGQSVPLFTPMETAHLADVKTLLRWVGAVQLAALTYVVAYVVLVYVWAREGPVRELAGAVVWSAVGTLAFLGATGAMALAGFDAFWDRLHQALFRNDLWRLDPARHHLIQMFPEEFWFQMVALVVGGTLALMAVLAGLALAYLWLTRPGRGTRGAPLPQDSPTPPQLAAGGPVREGLGGGPH